MSHEQNRMAAAHAALRKKHEEQRKKDEAEYYARHPPPAPVPQDIPLPEDSYSDSSEEELPLPPKRPAKRKREIQVKDYEPEEPPQKQVKRPVPKKVTFREPTVDEPVSKTSMFPPWMSTLGNILVVGASIAVPLLGMVATSRAEAPPAQYTSYSVPQTTFSYPPRSNTPDAYPSFLA